MTKSKHIKGKKLRTIEYEHRTPYTVKVRKISVNKKFVYGNRLSNKKAFKANFDSGTTYTFIPKTAFKAVMTQIGKHCKKKSSNCGGGKTYEVNTCFKYSEYKYGSLDKFFASFPNITLHMGFSGSRIQPMTWTPRNYLREINTLPQGFVLSEGLAKEPANFDNAKESPDTPTTTTSNTTDSNSTASNNTANSTVSTNSSTPSNSSLADSKTGDSSDKEDGRRRVLEKDSSKGPIYLCNSVRERQRGAPSLLGNMMMRGHDLYIDRGEGEIKWVESECK